MRELNSLKRVMAMVAACVKSAANSLDRMTDDGVPQRAGHRTKSPQRRKAHADGRFRRMAYFYPNQKLPKGVIAPGFKEFTNIGGRIYLVRHGSNYRLDRLLKSGLAKLASA